MEDQLAEGQLLAGQLALGYQALGYRAQRCQLPSVEHPSRLAEHLSPSVEFPLPSAGHLSRLAELPSQSAQPRLLSAPPGWKQGWLLVDDRHKLWRAFDWAWEK